MTPFTRIRPGNRDLQRAHNRSGTVAVNSRLSPMREQLNDLVAATRTAPRESSLLATRFIVAHARRRAHGLHRGGLIRTPSRENANVTGSTPAPTSRRTAGAAAHAGAT